MDLLSVLQRGNWQRIEEAKRNFKLNTRGEGFPDSRCVLSRRLAGKRWKPHCLEHGSLLHEEELLNCDEDVTHWVSSGSITVIRDIDTIIDTAVTQIRDEHYRNTQTNFLYLL